MIAKSRGRAKQGFKHFPALSRFSGAQVNVLPELHSTENFAQSPVAAKETKNI